MEFLSKVGWVTGTGYDRSFVARVGISCRRMLEGNRVMHGSCPGCVFTPT
jgi:hypothetical protein